MIKNIAFRLIQYRVKNYLPKVNPKIFKKVFTLSYRFFTFVKPSQLWIIILALLNKTDLKNLISIPSMFILFNSIISDSSEKVPLNAKSMYSKLEAQGFLNSENNLETFFWVVIVLALIKRFVMSLFRFLWLPFKIAFIYFILKYFGFNFDYAYNVLNNLSLGVVDWFYQKIITFFNLFNQNDKNN